MEPWHKYFIKQRKEILLFDAKSGKNKVLVVCRTPNYQQIQAQKIMKKYPKVTFLFRNPTRFQFDLDEYIEVNKITNIYFIKCSNRKPCKTCDLTHALESGLRATGKISKRGSSFYYIKNFTKSKQTKNYVKKWENEIFEQIQNGVLKNSTLTRILILTGSHGDLNDDGLSSDALVNPELHTEDQFNEDEKIVQMLKKDPKTDKIDFKLKNLYDLKTFINMDKYLNKHCFDAIFLVYCNATKAPVFRGLDGEGFIVTAIDRPSCRFTTKRRKCDCGELFRIKNESDAKTKNVQVISCTDEGKTWITEEMSFAIDNK